MAKPTRPKARPESKLAPKKTPRPKERPIYVVAPDEGESPTAKKAMGGPVKGYAMGGKCRGMGAAKRGGNYKAG